MSASGFPPLATQAVECSTVSVAPLATVMKLCYYKGITVLRYDRTPERNLGGCFFRLYRGLVDNTVSRP